MGHGRVGLLRLDIPDGDGLLSLHVQEAKITFLCAVKDMGCWLGGSNLGDAVWGGFKLLLV